MHQACPPSEPAPTGALRLNISQGHAGVRYQGRGTLVNESTDASRLPPGLTVDGHA